MVIGNALTVGWFGWRKSHHGTPYIVKLQVKSTKQGYISTYEKATIKEIKDIIYTIKKDAFQIELRYIPGCLGLWKPTDALCIHSIVHQAKGKPHENN
jgi:hypothetical protein